MSEIIADATGAEVLRAYFASQTQLLIDRREDVINDVPDAVHKSRVATRRLRSLLQTFKPVLDQDQTEPARNELRWWADMLGAPRDAEVLRDKLIAAINELPAQDRRGPVSERIQHDLTEAHRIAHARVVAEIDGDRARNLVEVLSSFSAQLPVATAALDEASKVVPPLVEKACLRVDRTWKAAEAASGLQRLTLWHDTRKRAKAARYAGDAMVAAFGESAKKLGAAYALVTEALGELQDCVVAAERLVELAHVADQAGESTRTYWTLIRLEHDHAASFETQGQTALRKVARSGVRDWLLPAQSAASRICSV